MSRKELAQDQVPQETPKRHLEKAQKYSHNIVEFIKNPPTENIIGGITAGSGVYAFQEADGYIHKTIAIAGVVGVSYILSASVRREKREAYQRGRLNALFDATRRGKVWEFERILKPQESPGDAYIQTIEEMRQEEINEPKQYKDDIW